MQINFAQKVTCIDKLVSAHFALTGKLHSLVVEIKRLLIMFEMNAFICRCKHRKFMPFAVKTSPELKNGKTGEVDRRILVNLFFCLYYSFYYYLQFVGK